MAISNKSVISYHIYDGSVKGDNFTDFIKELIVVCGKEKTLLMDNATIHRTKDFTTYVEQNKLNVLYNNPYNPQTNPIEMIFSPVKNNIKSNKTSTISSIRKSIDTYIKNVKEETLTKMFNKAFSKSQ